MSARCRTHSFGTRFPGHECTFAHLIAHILAGVWIFVHTRSHMSLSRRPTHSLSFSLSLSLSVRHTHTHTHTHTVCLSLRNASQQDMLNHRQDKRLGSPIDAISIGRTGCVDRPTHVGGAPSMDAPRQLIETRTLSLVDWDHTETAAPSRIRAARTFEENLRWIHGRTLTREKQR